MREIEPNDFAGIARMEEARQVRGIAAVADVSEEIAGGSMCFAGAGSWANQATGLGMSGPVDAAQSDRLIDFYQSRGVEPRIEVCPHAHESLIRGLADRSFVVREFKNVLVRDLRVPLPDLSQAAATIEITRLDPADERQVQQYVAIKVAGFEVTETEIFARLARRSLAAGQVVGMLASIGGKHVAVGSIEATPPCAGMFGMTTLKEFRRRGCQQALMIVRLRVAADNGCRFVTIQSEPHIGTGRNALRLGFQVAYTKVTLVRPGAGLIPSP